MTAPVGDGPSELFAANERIQGLPAVRLLATHNLAAYATLMERHLDQAARMTETELVSRLSQDMDAVGLGDMTPSALIKRWAREGLINRLTSGTGAARQNYCSLSDDARDALAFLRRLRRSDSVATGGTMEGIAGGLKKIASQLDEDPERVRSDLETQISNLFERLAELDEGRRPEPNMLNLTDEAQSIALQMEQIVNDVVRCGGMQDEITTRLCTAVEETDSQFRDRSGRLFDDYDGLFRSRERASYMAFAHTVQDPDARSRLKSDIDMVIDGLPDLNPGLRDVMRNFFRLVTEQMREVARVEQRCAQRIHRHFRSGTADQARGLLRQINEAIASAQELLSVSIVDSSVNVDFPLGALEMTSVDRLTFTIEDPTPPSPVGESTELADLSGFSALAAQVDMSALIGLINSAVAVGPISLPEVVGMLDTPLLGDVTVLWSMASKQDEITAETPVRRIRFGSIDGGEFAMDVPELVFHEPIPDAEQLL